MSYQYLNHAILKSCIAQDGATINLDDVYIGSCADALYIGDQLKENLSWDVYLQHYQNLLRPNIYWAELGKEVFLENTFLDHNHLSDVGFFENIEDSQTSPLNTCNIIAIKPNDNICYWDESVYEEVMQSLI